MLDTERERADLCDTGTAPEFYITDIGKTEPACGPNVRFYMCVRRGNLLLVQFTLIVPIINVAVMAREAMQISADYHNSTQIGRKVTAH